MLTSTRAKAIMGCAVVGAGLAVAAGYQAHAAPSVPVPPDARTLAVANWLGTNTTLHDQGWRLVTDVVGSRYQSHVSGVGLVEVDAATKEVDEVIFDGRLQSSPGRSTVSATQAHDTALSFAQGHFRGFDGLTLRDSSSLDHGTFREVRVEWQARSGQAWLPTKVAVGVNAATGQVAYYWSERVPLRVSATPSVAAATAIQRAQETAPGLTVTSGPTLEVTIRSGEQHLVWITELTRVYATGAHVPDYRVVWTDARTGLTQIAAQS
jgi:hypothetical protein